MKFEEVAQEIGKLGILKFFPADVGARLAIAEDLSDMTNDIEHVRWLVKRMRQLHNEWPGAKEMRAVYCSRYRPLDGIDAYSELPKFADGIPSDPDAERARLTSTPALAITGEVSDQTWTDEYIHDVIAQRIANYRKPKPPVVSQAEIEEIKQIQERNRKENVGA